MHLVIAKTEITKVLACSVSREINTNNKVEEKYNNNNL